MDTQITKQQNVLLLSGKVDLRLCCFHLHLPYLKHLNFFQWACINMEAIIFRKNDLPPYPTSCAMWHLHLLSAPHQKAPPCSLNTGFKASASEAVVSTEHLPSWLSSLPSPTVLYCIAPQQFLLSTPKATPRIYLLPISFSINSPYKKSIGLCFLNKLPECSLSEMMTY